MSLRVFVLVSFVLAVAPASSSAQPFTPYGAPITLEHARKLIAAAEAEAVKQKWPVAIAIVDGSGQLVAFARLDNTQIGSIEIALEKAKCAALFRRPTKVFEDAVAKGGENLRALKAPGIIPIEGGLPIVHEGKVIGAIGVSGVKSSEDGQVAQAGIASLQKKQ
jgi:glc operon protein GlcG